MAKKPNPIDVLDGPKIVLAGRIVTMDAAFSVLANGRLYIEKGAIVAVQEDSALAPPGFANAKVIDTAGTIYPGLIELHNHLAYNALQLWDVPKRYGNRDQWAGIPEYRKRISGPMKIIGVTPGLLPALIRYVEVKCLLGGVTTSQGIELYSNAGIRRYYRGIVRNVEQTDEPDLPEAKTKIADVDAQSAEAFLKRLLKQSCFLLHLSEGIDAAARKHFLALKIAADNWAITPQLAGIHCAGLTAADFAVYGENGGAMIWSPLSNLLLYGDTANVAAAKQAGVRIAIGSDWSPSGSKNLLGELKVAKIWSDQHGVFADRELIAMATTTPAQILGWEPMLGSLETGKRADVLVISGSTGDPYTALLQAQETDILLLLINGVPRYGATEIMGSLKAPGEKMKVGSETRQLFLKQTTQDLDVSAISLKKATAILKKALKTLPKLAAELEKPKPAAALPRGPRPVVWRLALDELEDTGVQLRPRLPFNHRPTGARALSGAGAKPLSEVVEPLELDPITIADDAHFLERIAEERNLPPFVKEGLLELYNG